MLTSDLVRAVIRKGRVYPQYLKLSDEALEKALELVGVFEGGLDGERGTIEEAVTHAIGHGTDFLVWRGLAKLLYDRSEFEVAAAHPPEEIRSTVFELAAVRGPIDSQETRHAVLEAASDQLGISVEECEAGLYADLEDRQILTSFREVTPLSLLERYNLALAQAILYKATRLVVLLEDRDPNKLRYLFQVLKFHRLMHTARAVDAGYEIVIDGPASLFKQNRKYGLQMAMFLPALLHATSWSLRAELDWRGNGTTQEFLLSADEGLVSHYKPRGQWVAEEERWFEKKFAKSDTGWTLERRGTIVELPDNEVIIPDYVLTNEDGHEVYLEIVGFWRLAYLERRIAWLAKTHAPLVLVVSERLKSDRQKLVDAPPEVVFFKGAILVDKVLGAAQAVLEARA